MQPVHIEDTTDYLCKCGHKHHEHFDGVGCLYGCYDEIDEDACCECTSYETKE